MTELLCCWQEPKIQIRPSLAEEVFRWHYGGNLQYCPLFIIFITEIETDAFTAGRCHVNRDIIGETPLKRIKTCCLLTPEAKIHSFLLIHLNKTSRHKSAKTATVAPGAAGGSTKSWNICAKQRGIIYKGKVEEQRVGLLKTITKNERRNNSLYS